MTKGKVKKTISIPVPNIEQTIVRIKGTAPLIFHKWSEKAKRQILDKQMKKAKRGREKRNPQEDYENSFYYNSKGEISLPARNIKQAIVGAARNFPDVKMTEVRGSIFVLGDDGEGGLIKVNYKSKKMREDMVRVRGEADIRFRGQVEDWSMEFRIKYNATMFSGEQVLNLLYTAGFAQGLGEWRPERNGDFGTFEVEN